MARGRIGAGGPFLVDIPSGSFTANPKIRPVLVLSFQSNVRGTLRYRLKTKVQLGKVFGKKPIFPAPIWVTRAVNKRRGLSARIVSRWALGEPTVPVVVVVTIKPKAIRVATLVEFQRRRPKTIVRLIPKFGKATTKVRAVGLRVIKFVSQQRKPFRGKVSLRRPIRQPIVVVATKKFGPRLIAAVSKIRRPFRGKVLLRKPTRVVVVVSPKFRVTLLQISQHQYARQQPKTKTQFTKKYGKATTRVSAPKAIKYLKFAAQHAERRARFISVKVILGEAPRTFTFTPPIVTEHLYIIMLPHMGQLMNH